MKEEALLERMVARLAVDVRNSGGLVKEFAPDLGMLGLMWSEMNC